MTNEELEALNKKWLPTEQLEDLTLLKIREARLIDSIELCEQLEHYEIFALHTKWLVEVQERLKQLK